MKILNACYDFGYQPISLGDLLLFHAAAEIVRQRHGFDQLKFCLVYDFKEKGMADPAFRDINQDNIGATLRTLTEVLQLSQRVSAIHIFDSYAKGDAHEESLSASEVFWPAKPTRKQYHYYWILNEIIPEFAGQQPLNGLFEWREPLLQWCKTFFQAQVHPRVPVCVQLRSNPNIDPARNAQIDQWHAFFTEAVQNFPVSFIIIGSKSEIVEQLRSIPHVHYAKDHGSSAGQDLALIKSSLFYMGSPSGPTVLPLVDGVSFCCIGQKVLPDQTVPQSKLPLVPMPGMGARKFSFNRDDQILIEAQETTADLWRIFQHLYAGRQEAAVSFYRNVGASNSPHPDSAGPMITHPTRTAKTILLYTDESTAGGVAQYNHGLLPALLTAGWKTYSAQPQNDSPLLVKQRELGVVQKFLSYAPTHAFARSFTDTTDPERIMAELKPDLVYFSDCCPLSNIAAKHVAISRKIPFVVISHSAADYLAQRFPACLPIVKQQLARAQDVIAISQKNLDILRSHFGLVQNKGVVVHNGRPASFFTPSNPDVRQRIRTELRIPEDGVLCFTSARFDSAKGYQHQLAAIRQLQARNALGKLYFAWAGTGELHQKFTTEITAAGLDSRIRLLGQRWDITDLLDASDLFVLTTMLEGGLPLSVMEAMAKGVATIVTSVSGIAGVAEGATRLLPDPNENPAATATALAEALDQLARDLHKRAKLSQAGRTLAERNFRQETNATKTLAVLESSLRPRAVDLPSEPHAPAAAVSSASSSAPGPSAKKEGFLLQPDFSNEEWQKIILAYLQAFSPNDPVALIIHGDTSQSSPLTPPEAQSAILELIRQSGKAAFADIVLIDKPTDLLDTLRHYPLIHRLPFSGTPADLSTPTKQRLISTLAVPVAV